MINIKHFDHFTIPNTWRHYWTKYPEGYTIIEALIDWITKVNDMVDNQNDLIEDVDDFRKELDDFIAEFDGNLADKVGDILEEWQESGFLEVIINEALQTHIDEVEELLKDVNESMYYQDSIKVERKRHSDSATYYHLTTIKHKDGNGDVIPLKINYTGPQKLKTIREHADETNATVATNASWSDGGVMNGITIVDGEVISNKKANDDSMYVLGLTETNDFKIYPSTTDEEQILNDGVVNAITAFIPLIQGGVKVSDELLELRNSPVPNPRQAIGRYSNGDIVFLTSGGRNYDGQGMTGYDLVDIFEDLGVEHAFMLDGGGAAQTVVRNVLISHPIDGAGTSERSEPLAFYVSKPKEYTKIDKTLKSMNKQISDIKMVADSKIRRTRLAFYSIPLEHGWDGELEVNVFNSGDLEINGKLTVGEVGSIQTHIGNLREEHAPRLLRSFNVVAEDGNYTSYPGLTVDGQGRIYLRNPANENFAEGDRIFISAFLKWQ